MISTSTSTGLAVARRAYPDLVTFYAPLDFSWATRRAIARVRPTVLAPVELELWPNLIRAAKRSGSKVAIINARLSTRSYRGYLSVRRPLKPTLGRIDVVAAQNGDYARRLRGFRDSESSNQRDGLGEIRRARERPEQREDA